jgi:hypothetical protein
LAVYFLPGCLYVPNIRPQSAQLIKKKKKERERENERERERKERKKT